MQSTESRARAFPAAMIAIAIAFMAASCSFDYSGMSLDDELSEKIPSTVFYDFNHTIIDNGKTHYRIKARMAEYYEKSDLYILYDAVFAEFDSATGDLVTVGTSTKTTFTCSSNDAEMSGEINFYSASQKTRIYSEYFSWQNDAKVLEGRRDRMVTVSKDDGTLMRGEGFRGELLKKVFSFSGHTEGVYVDESE